MCVCVCEYIFYACVCVCNVKESIRFFNLRFFFSFFLRLFFNIKLEKKIYVTFFLI